MKFAKKGTLSAAIILLLCFFITGCKQKDEKTIEQIDMKGLQETMLAADETLPQMLVNTSNDENADLNFTSLSDMEYERVSDYFYAYSKTGTAQEIAVIQLKDSKDAATLMQSLQRHVEHRVQTLQEYNPEQTAMAENALIIRNSSCVALIICEKNGMVQNAFEEFFNNSSAPVQTVTP